MVSYIILALTGDCNLKCYGCYAHANEKDYFDKFKILKSLNTLLKRYNINHIVMHGGEPLLIDKNDFDDILKFIKYKSPKTSLSIQTNATLIDDEWIEIFKKYNMVVGTSYRGYRELFNKLSCSERYDDYIYGIDLLRKNNLLNSGIFYYPTKYEDEVFENIENIIDDVVNLGYKIIDLHMPIGEGILKHYADIYIKAQEYIFDKGYDLRLRDLNMLYDMFSGSRSFLKNCTWKHNCYEYITLTGQGEIFWCNKKPETFKFLYDECLNCPIFGICNGGCEAIRNFNDGKFPYCVDRIKMVKYVIENIKKFYLHYDFLR